MASVTLLEFRYAGRLKESRFGETVAGCFITPRPAAAPGCGPILRCRGCRLQGTVGLSSRVR